jgi:4'-phosphopantetheinyl transferase
LSFEPQICKIQFPLATLAELEVNTPPVVLWTHFSELVEFLPRFRSVLSQGELDRATRFAFERDRQRWVIGRGLLRHLLGHYLNVSPSEIRLTYGEFGKPGVAGLEFNLAHADDVLIYAFSRNKVLGIDVEPVRLLSDLEKIVENFFAASEQALILSAPLAERPYLFFRHWTLKEAFIKATGKGLNMNLTDFSVRLGSGSENASVCIEPSDLVKLSTANLFSHEFTISAPKSVKISPYLCAVVSIALF